MKKRIAILFLMPLFLFAAVPQQVPLPIKEWPASTQTSFVFYITGDGGFNSFSTTLCNVINKAGYSITAMNAKTYFWDKKTPDETALAITAYLEKQFNNRPDQQLALVGYSFGADVMPFIINRMAPSMKNKLTSVVLISPSTSTDFEIHWSDMFGGKTKRSMDVAAEINKMNVPRVTTFFGAEEGDFPIKNVQLKNYHNRILPGGHRFDGHADELAEMVMKEF